MKILSVVGTRPQYVKLSAIYHAAKARDIHHDWIDTGQHYSAGMSEEIIKDFKLPKPKLNLKVGSGPHGKQTGKMLQGVESFLVNNDYDFVLVYGDTNSTVAGALAASKLGIPVAHIESGLRSGNMQMPEEQNRRIVDHLASILFAPTNNAIQNLKNEGLTGVVNSGDIMLDVLQKTLGEIGVREKTKSEYVLCTIHRAENTDSKIRLETIFRALEKISLPVTIPVHPRLHSRLEEFKIKPNRAKIDFIEPLKHRDLVEKVLDARCVVTDSGGLQKEAYLVQKICITIRAETEWPETLEYGWNVLNPSLDDLDKLILRDSPRDHNNFFGDGNTADLILNELQRCFNQANGG